MTGGNGKTAPRGACWWLLGLALAAAVALPVPTGRDAAAAGLLDKAEGMLGALGQKAPAGGAAGQLSSDEIASGLREALSVGTAKVVGRLGAPDGFNGDRAVHIPLPGPLKTVQSTLQMIGMAGLADDLELRMNRAAEATMPEAKTLFVGAIQRMTLTDARGILSGPKDSATRYFQSKMSKPLARRMAPIVERELADAGAVQALDAMMGQYNAIPLAPDVGTDLTTYVVNKALDGLFHYVAAEEAAIRTNPAARTTELLRKVFAG